MNFSVSSKNLPSFDAYVTDHANEELAEKKFIQIFKEAINALKEKSPKITIDDIAYKIGNKDLPALTKYAECFFKTHSLEEKKLQELLSDINSASDANYSIQVSDILNLKKLLILNTPLESAESPVSEVSAKIIKLQESQKETMVRLQEKMLNIKKSTQRKDLIKAGLITAGSCFILSGILMAIYLNPALILLTVMGFVLFIPGVVTNPEIKDTQAMKNRLNESVKNFEVLEKAKTHIRDLDQFLKDYRYTLEEHMQDNHKFIQLLRTFVEAQNVKSH